MAEYMQGIFNPKNKEKYKGTLPIIYRSSWEFSYMMRLDADPTVIEWSSESIIVPYTDKATGKFHRYFPDFVVKKKEGTEVKTYMIEIKPEAQTREPKRGKKKRKTFINEVKTWGKNTGKWEAAERFCKAKGWQFMIITESDIPQWKKM